MIELALKAKTLSSGMPISAPLLGLRPLRGCLVRTERRAHREIHETQAAVRHYCPVGPPRPVISEHPPKAALTCLE